MRPSNYNAFRVQADNSRGLPKGVGTRAATLQALPPSESLPIANDGSGKILVNLDRRWVSGRIPIVNNPHVAELTDTEYEALKPEPITTP